MRISEAIAKADEIRPNALSDEQKARIVYEIECEIATLTGAEKPVYDWPHIDSVLILTAPDDLIYVTYLCAKIDFYNQETTLYANDMEIHNAAYAEFAAKWRREHRPAPSDNWRTM